MSELNSEGGPARRIPTLHSLLENPIHSLILNVIHLTGYVVCVAVYPTAFADDFFYAIPCNPIIIIRLLPLLRSAVFLRRAL